MPELPFQIGQIFKAGGRRAKLIRTPNADQRFAIKYQGEVHNVSLAELIAIVLEAISAGQLEVED
jgi:hypothetical protein